MAETGRSQDPATLVQRLCIRDSNGPRRCKLKVTLDVTLEPSIVSWAGNGERRHHKDGEAGPSSLHQRHHMAAGGKPVLR